MGSVYRRTWKAKDGKVRRSKRWWMDYRDATGKRIRKPASTDKKISHSMLRKEEEEAERIRMGGPEKGSLDTSLSGLARLFLMDMELHLKPRTLQDYREVLGILLLRDTPALSVKKVARLKPTTVKEYQAKASRKLASRTVNKHIRILGTMLNWAVNSQLIPCNPIKGVRMLPVVPTRPQRALSEEEISELLLVADADSRDIWILFLDSGLRKREMASLTWADIDFEAQQIRVRAEETKTGKGRTIPMSDGVLQILDRRHKEADPEPGDVVLPSICGRPFYTQALHVFKLDAEAAGIDPAGVHIHGLRRTFATRLIRAGADPKTVQTLLGHSTLELTLQLYTDAKAMDLRSAINRLPTLRVEEAHPVYWVLPVTGESTSIPRAS